MHERHLRVPGVDINAVPAVAAFNFRLFTVSLLISFGIFSEYLFFIQFAHANFPLFKGYFKTLLKKASHFVYTVFSDYCLIYVNITFFQAF